MFCVECGKEESVFRDGVCLECYLKSHSFTKGFEFIDIPTCAHCESYKYKSTWTSELFGDILKKFIKKDFKISKELKKIDINTECKEEKERIACKIYISGFVDDIQITEEHDAYVRLKKTVCDVCSKRFGGYHEAIIQIRTDKRNLEQKEREEIISNVESLVETLRTKGNRSLFITDIGIEHGGLDFFLSDKSAALVITKKIQGQNGGEIKQSSRNMGMKDGRQLYRVTYLLRLPSYKKNDFIKIKGSFYYVTSIQKNKIKLIDLSNWEEVITEVNSINRSNILGGMELIKEMILVNQTEEEVQIMDEKSYKIIIVKKPKPIIFSSEKIKTINLEDKIFLTPTNT